MTSGLSRLRVAVVVFGALIIQLALFPDVHIFGVNPDVMLLVAVVAGSVGGPTTGATVGFATGLVIDLFVATPFGLSALAYTLAGFGVGAAQSGTLANSRVLRALFAGAGSGFGVALYALVGAIVGQPQMLHMRLVRVIVVVAMVNVGLSLPAYGAMRWALSGPEPGRRRLRRSRPSMAGSRGSWR